MQVIAVAVSDGNFDAVLPGCLENLISFCWAPAEKVFLHRFLELPNGWLPTSSHGAGRHGGA